MPRQATLDDLPEILPLVVAFHSSSPWCETTLDEKYVEYLAAKLIQAGGIFLNGTGLIAGMLTPILFNPDLTIAIEIIWYAPQGGGRQLREAFESWAQSQGALGIQMSALPDDNFDKINHNFLQNSFVISEIQYMKKF